MDARELERYMDSFKGYLKSIDDNSERLRKDLDSVTRELRDMGKKLDKLVDYVRDISR